MWNNTRELIQNSLNNFGQIFRRDGSNSSIDLDFRRRTIRRSRRTNRTNCLGRSSTRASTLNSQLNRELLNSSQPLRPPHVHRTRSCHSSLSSNQSSPSSQHTCFTPLPTETINHSSPSPTQSPSALRITEIAQTTLPNRSLSPILPIVANSRFPIISCPPHSNVFSQHYLRSISRSFCNLAGADLHPLQITKQKNYLACLINLLVIVTIVIAILQPKWFSINGGACNRYIGLQVTRSTHFLLHFLIIF